MNATKSDAKRRSRIPLIQGNQMVCPRCKTQRNILDFQVLDVIEEFAADTTPVYKCPKQRGGCSFLFAPAEQAILTSMIGESDG
jgi:hypothetical protein